MTMRDTPEKYINTKSNLKSNFDWPQLLSHDLLFLSRSTTQADDLKPHDRRRLEGLKRVYDNWEWTSVQDWFEVCPKNIKRVPVSMAESLGELATEYPSKEGGRQVHSFLKEKYQKIVNLQVDPPQVGLHRDQFRALLPEIHALLAPFKPVSIVASSKRSTISHESIALQALKTMAQAGIHSPAIPSKSVQNLSTIPPPRVPQMEEQKVLHEVSNNKNTSLNHVQNLSCSQGPTSTEKLNQAKAIASNPSEVEQALEKDTSMTIDSPPSMEEQDRGQARPSMDAGNLAIPAGIGNQSSVTEDIFDTHMGHQSEVHQPVEVVTRLKKASTLCQQLQAVLGDSFADLLAIAANDLQGLDPRIKEVRDREAALTKQQADFDSTKQISAEDLELQRIEIRQGRQDLNRDRQGFTESKEKLDRDRKRLNEEKEEFAADRKKAQQQLEAQNQQYKSKLSEHVARFEFEHAQHDGVISAAAIPSAHTTRNVTTPSRSVSRESSTNSLLADSVRLNPTSKRPRSESISNADETTKKLRTMGLQSTLPEPRAPVANMKSSDRAGSSRVGTALADLSKVTDEDTIRVTPAISRIGSTL